MRLSVPVTTRSVPSTKEKHPVRLFSRPEWALYISTLISSADSARFQKSTSPTVVPERVKAVGADMTPIAPEQTPERIPAVEPSPE